MGGGKRRLKSISRSCDSLFRPKYGERYWRGTPQTKRFCLIHPTEGSAPRALFYCFHKFCLFFIKIRRWRHQPKAERVPGRGAWRWSNNQKKRHKHCSLVYGLLFGLLKSDAAAGNVPVFTLRWLPLPDTRPPSSFTTYNFSMSYSHETAEAKMLLLLIAHLPARKSLT